MKPCAHKSSFKAIFFQRLQSNVLAEFNAGLNFYTHILDDFNFRNQHVPRESIGWNTHGHHTASHRQFFKDLWLIALQTKEIGGSKTGWTSSDDSDLFIPVFSLFRNIRCITLQVHIGNKTVEMLNGDGFFHISTGTNLLTWMMTHSTTCCRKGMVGFE